MRATAGQWWSILPANQPSFIAGSAPEQIRDALDPLPADAPPVVFLWASAVQPFSEQILWLINEMDRVAVRLFDRWLPDAAELPDASPMSVATVVTLAKHLADQSAHYRPLITDIAKRALFARFGLETRINDSFAPEVRAAGLVRVLADAYGRSNLAVLVEVPGGLTKVQQLSLVGAASWLCQHSAAAVWFTGAPLDLIDTVLVVPIFLGGPGGLVASGVGDVILEPIVVFPALAGQPRADSAAEMALEEELRRHEWAASRRWNHIFPVPGTATRYRFDLLWDAEMLIVEVDGDDHRTQAKYAADRVRDVTLALLGYQIIRFTNDLVVGHVETAADQIRQLLCMQQERNRAAQGA